MASSFNPIFTDIFDSSLLDNNTTNGTNLNDNIVLDNGNDTSQGNAGDDLIHGGGGNDTLNGGVGNDILIGGAGNDSLIGGAGKDKFRFKSLAEGVDRIQDFNVADDTIEIDASAVNLPRGSVTSSRFFIGAAANNSTQRFIYDKNTGGFFFDKDGNGPQTAVQIANLSTGLQMTSNDIFLF